MKKTMYTLLIMFIWNFALHSKVTKTVEKKDIAFSTMETRKLLPGLKEKLEQVINNIYSIDAVDLIAIIGQSFDEIPIISAKKLKERMAKEKDLSVVNVLNDWLHKDCHITGSINVPLPKLIDIVANWDRNKKIVVYCALDECDAGQKAYIILTCMGFNNVMEYPGGIKDWFNCKYPTEGPCAQSYLHEDAPKRFLGCPCKIEQKN